VGLSNSKGVLKFVEPKGWRSGTGYITRSDSTIEEDISKVPVTTLDSMSDRFADVSFMHIDTEGEELRILKGGTEIIRKHKPTLILEASDAMLRRAGGSLDELYTFLRAHGYSMYGIERWSMREVQVDGINAKNWLCLQDDIGLHRIQSHVRMCGIMPMMTTLNPLCLR
jgi:hypothetical protein